MSSKDDWSQEWSIVLSIAAIAAMLMAAVFAIFLLPFVAVIVFVIGGIYYYFHSPSYLERKAQEHTQQLFEQVRGTKPANRDRWINELIRRYDSDENIAVAGLKLFDQEGFAGPPPPPKIANSIEGARYRDQLGKFSTYDPAKFDDFKEKLFDAFDRLRPDEDGGEFVVEEQLTNRQLEDFIEAFYGDDTLFVDLRRRFDKNLEEAGSVLPRDYKGDNAALAYLKGTPLLDMAKRKRRISLGNRFEHMHIVAGTGHGKTQTLQYLISRDLEEDCSIIVIESKGSTINRIANLDIPTDRLVLIDPTDVEYPVALNLFDVGTSRVNQHSAFDRERLTNSIIELYDYVLGALLGAELTSKQAVVFRYITRLMLHIEGATLHTFIDLMRPGATDRYAKEIGQLSPTAKAFFETEFNGRQFNETKDQVLRRLYGILENQTFERMFSNEQNKIDLYTAMAEGKVVLINTAKNLLKDTGAQVLGRFFIALITQAMQERVNDRHKKPVYVYIDEAADYLSDSNLETILSQAREQNVGLIIAHQYLGQLSPKLQQSLATNAAIKFAGGVSPQDARVLAGEMRTTPEFVRDQPKGSFAAHIKGHTDKAVSLRIPFGVMEEMHTVADFDVVRDAMRRRYAVRHVEPTPPPPPDPVPTPTVEPAQSPPEPDDPDRKTATL